MISPDNPRLILGLKLRNLRRERELTLRQLAAAAGLSVSYLSEIEKGKKYPQPEKLVRLAEALEVAFDELVSLQVADELGPLKAAVTSGFIREFPFELFGLDPGDLWGLMAGDPARAGALARTFLEVGRSYDVRVEHFLLAALRSYQQMKGNYFADLEEDAASFRETLGWPVGRPIQPRLIATYLEEEWSYRIDRGKLASEPALSGFRSVYREGEPPTLFLNDRLMPSQQAFVLGREIGYRHLGLDQRAVSSSWLKVESFEQVLNNFKASYFSGALLLDRATMGRGLEKLLAGERFDGGALVALMTRYDATPETFFTRLSQLLPGLFGLDEIYFMRFTSPADHDSYQLTKVLNMSGVPVPHGVGLGEHYCRRWPAVRLLGELAGDDGDRAMPAIRAQRSHFLGEGVEFLELATVRRLALARQTRSSVSLGLRLDRRQRQVVGFASDPAIPRVEVNLTCERCGLVPADCAERAAPPSIHRELESQAERERALAELVGRG